MTAGKARFTAAERRAIGESPAVEKVTDNRIFLSDAFRAHLLARVERGDSPTRVFRDAGLGPELIGHKRIERATAHVRESAQVHEWLERNGDVWDEDRYFDRADADDDARPMSDDGTTTADMVMVAMSYRITYLERRIRNLETLLRTAVPAVSGGGVR